MSASFSELLIEHTQLALGILEAERARLAGEPGYSLEEVAGEMKEVVRLAQPNEH